MDIFEEYVKNYDMNDSNIDLKYYHTKRVANLCKYIAESLNLSSNDIKLAELCGWLHDIGRFPQAKLYHTFEDLNSIDHGDLGYYIFNEQFKDKIGLSKEDEQIVQNAIMYHNKKELPDIEDERANCIISILRDADKIDILYQAINWPILREKHYDEISAKCNEDFNHKRVIDTASERTENDHVLRYYAFIWDIQYDISLKIIKENGYLDTIYEKSNKAVFTPYYETINSYMEDMKWKQNMILKRQN